MREKFYAELSRRLREKGIESSCAGTQNLNVLLHGQPVLFVAPSSEIFILPAGSQNEEVNDLYHRVGETADEVYEYVEAVQGAPLLHASDLKEEFRYWQTSDVLCLLAENEKMTGGTNLLHGFGISTGAVLATAITMRETTMRPRKTLLSVPD